jgi:transcriptional regulator with XRE-family HTH domain
LPFAAQVRFAVKRGVIEMRGVLRPNSRRIRELREGNLGPDGEPKNQLQFALDCGLSERTIQNVESGRPVSRATAQSIADCLGVPLDSIFSTERDRPRTKTAPGQPDYYIPFVTGIWIARCNEHEGVNYRGERLPPWVHHWRFEIERDKNGLCGTCHCITPGFEHGRFDLIGHIDGSRFVHIEGIRSGGVDHFFKTLLRFENDGRTTRLMGGYVVFNPEQQTVLVGDIEFTREQS